MGDRCYLQMTLRKLDYDKHGMNEFFDQHIEPLNEKGVITVDEAEANWGYVNELEEWVAHGFPFQGWHAPGSEYRGHLFACDGREYAAVECSDHAIPVVGVRTDGNVDPDEMKEIRRFQEIDARAHAMLEGRRARPRRSVHNHDNAQRRG